jgi:hypothetical protein
MPATITFWDIPITGSYRYSFMFTIPLFNNLMDLFTKNAAFFGLIDHTCCDICG